MYKNREGYPDPTRQSDPKSRQATGGGRELPAGDEADVCDLTCESAGEDHGGR